MRQSLALVLCVTLVLGCGTGTPEQRDVTADLTRSDLVTGTDGNDSSASSPEILLADAQQNPDVAETLSTSDQQMPTDEQHPGADQLVAAETDSTLTGDTTSSVDLNTADLSAPADVSDITTSTDSGATDVAASDASADLSSADPLSGLSDEFDSANSLSQWSRLWITEGWPHDALEATNIGSTRAGWLMMMPYSSSWYEEYRGVLMYKLVTGDFIVTTSVEVSNRAGNGAPGALYSLGGIFVRKPRPITMPSEWTPNGENYLFLSLGSANTPGTYQTEVKRTRLSVSALEINPGQATARIRVARIGAYFIMLIQFPGASWQVHRRYHHDQMQQTLQVGLTTYTDWNSITRVYPNNPQGYNVAAFPLDGQTTPDLIALFDYVRFRTPSVPGSWANADLTDSNSVSDVALLSVLGTD